MLQEMKHLFEEHSGEEMKDPKLKERAEVREKRKHCERKAHIKLFTFKLLCNFIEIALRYVCSLVNLLHIFRTPLYRNT